jgi:putative redox protein
MTTSSGHTPEHRSVTIQRTAPGSYAASNGRGGQISVGSGGSADFTPVELLLVAIGGCTAVDVDLVTSRRAEPETFAVGIQADKIRDEHGNRLTGIEVTFRIVFPDGEQGDAARAVLPGVLSLSHDRLCTVSRTIEVGTPITTRID